MLVASKQYNEKDCQVGNINRFLVNLLRRIETLPS